MTTAPAPNLAQRLYARSPDVVVFVIAFVVFAATASWTRATSIDVEATILPAIRIASDGTPWLEGLGLEGDNPWFVEVSGHLVSNRQVAVSLYAVPFYLASGVPYAVWPATLAAVVATALAVALMHGAVRKIAPPRVALGAALLMAVASPTWTVSADSLWGHTLTQLSISAAAFSAARNGWWLVGASLGVSIMARPHTAVIALILGLGVGWVRRSWRVPAMVGIPSVAAVGLLLVLNRWVYGFWTLTGYAAYGTNPTENLAFVASAGTATRYVVNWAGFLVAPDRGIFIWTPILLVLLPAAWRARRGAPDWVPLLLVGGLAYTAVQMRVNVFHGGDSFYGYRHGLELLTCALPLYALGWMRTRGWMRKLVVALLVLQISAMLLGALYPLGWLSYETVWTTNTLVHLIGRNPVAVGLIYLAALGLALLAARRTSLIPPWATSERPEPGSAAPHRIRSG